MNKIGNLITGYTCNSNCIFCAVKEQKNISDLTTVEVFKNIDLLKQNGAKEICILGGEPAIRPDIFEIISHCKTKKFKDICLFSNGKKLKEKIFVEQLKSVGLTNVFISLYGHNPIIHESCTRVQGSFSETLSGIVNCQRQGLNVTVNNVLTKMNYIYLQDFVSFCRMNHIKNINLSYVLPEGRAKKIYNTLAVKYSELMIQLRKAIKTPLLTISIKGVPDCILKELRILSIDRFRK